MSGHISPVRTYVLIFTMLMVFTAITVAVAFTNLGPFNFPVALSIAIVKATLAAGLAIACNPRYALNRTRNRMLSN